MDYRKIIDRYYPEDDALRHILITHSRAVADRALLIARRHPELALDRVFLEEAAMLHDIGVCRTDAAGIECFGTEPYIRHGIIGAEMMRAEDFPVTHVFVSATPAPESQNRPSRNARCRCRFRIFFPKRLRNRLSVTLTNSSPNPIWSVSAP